MFSGDSNPGKFEGASIYGEHSSGKENSVGTRT
jgi:hypothetical protein